ncbi:hypothetical protein [Staphylococcus argensis]|nr:hypothetical protein [Staphylococcus argensis]MCY6991319.1 hypothetical protein [Staphylococcus argensis]
MKNHFQSDTALTAEEREELAKLQRENEEASVPKKSGEDESVCRE